MNKRNALMKIAAFSVPYGVRDFLGQFSLGSARLLNRTIPSAMDTIAGIAGAAGGVLVGGVQGSRNGGWKSALKGAYNGGRYGYRDVEQLAKPYSDKVRRINSAIGLQDVEDMAQLHADDLDREAEALARRHPDEAGDILDNHQARKLLVPWGTRFAGTAAALGKFTDGWGTFGTSMK